VSARNGRAQYDFAVEDWDAVGRPLAPTQTSGGESEWWCRLVLGEAGDSEGAGERAPPAVGRRTPGGRPAGAATHYLLSARDAGSAHPSDVSYRTRRISRRFGTSPPSSGARAGTTDPLATARRRRSQRGLERYFAAVSARGCTREEKLRLVSECFAEDAVIVDPFGRELRGREGAEAFYGGPESPVLKTPDFAPRPVPASECWSADGVTVAVEIDLPDAGGGLLRVGDWFSFDREGRIERLTIFAKQHMPRRAGASGGSEESEATL
jgi:hypothetical protein